ncbi:hypothetical protein JHK86_004524 [Glycine max]|nr:hypothetical protein JHK86_004524 [Glycine max]
MHQSLFKDNDSHKESNEGHSRKTTKLTKVDGGEHPSRHDQSATTASRWLCETQSKESRWWRRPESVGVCEGGRNSLSNSCRKLMLFVFGTARNASVLVLRELKVSTLTSEIFARLRT